MYFIKNFNGKILLNTILTSKIQKYLLLTFIIPILFKNFIQDNINLIENTMVSNQI